MSLWNSFKGVMEPEIDFVPGARSRDTELGLFSQISKMQSMEAGDDRQFLTGLISLDMKRAIVIYFGVLVEVTEYTRVKFFLIQGQGQGRGSPKIHGGLKVLKYCLTPDRQTPTWSIELNGGFHIMSICDPFQGVTQPEFSISSQRLGHLTPNLSHLAKSAKCKVYFLEHGMSNGDEI